MRASPVRLKFIAPRVAAKASRPLPYIALEHLESGAGALIKGAEIVERDAFDTVAFQSGDVIFGKLRPYLAKSLLCSSPGTCSNELVVMRPDRSQIEPGYLAYLVRTRDFIDFAMATSEGVKMPRTSWEGVGSFKFWLPALAEQRALVANLDRSISAIDRLFGARRNMLALVHTRQRQVVDDALAGLLTSTSDPAPSGSPHLGDIPRHWAVRRFKHVLEQPLKYGANEAGEYDNPAWARYIRTTDVRADGSLRAETFKSLPPETAQDYMLSDGDLLLTRSGATVGKSLFYRGDWGPACFAGYLIRARVDRALMLPEYAQLFTWSSAYWSQIGETTIQATIQNVGADKYANLRVPVPPINEQSEIVRIVGDALANGRALITGLEAQIAALDEYRGARISAALDTARESEAAA